jgi:imidazolonepropionase-like amidohydrolase
MGLRRRCYSLALALVCGLVAGASHPAELALRASLAIDGHGREIRKPVIIVRRERISSIKSLGEVPPSVQLIDLPGFTLLPGLIDAHVHVTGYFPNQTSRRLPPTLWAARNARCLLESGFTTVRSLGSRLFEDVQLRDAIDQGLVPGPRLLVSGQPLKAPGTRRTGGEEGAPPARRMSEDRMRLLARRQLNGRIDWLKVFASESVRRGGGATYSEEELRWAVEEAHKRGVPVAAHAHAAEAARRAVAAGVTTIEHGALLDENTLQLLQETGTYLVPNLYLSEYYLRHWDRFGFGEEAKKLTEAALPQRTKVFRRAVERSCPDRVDRNQSYRLHLT